MTCPTCGNANYEPQTELPEWLQLLRTEIPLTHGVKWQERWEATIALGIGAPIDEVVALRVARAIVGHKKTYKNYAMVVINWYESDMKQSMNGNGRDRRAEIEALAKEYN